MKEKIIIAAITMALSVGATMLVVATMKAVALSVTKSEIVECQKLEKQSKEYAGFFLAKWQSDMCETHGFDITAPIR